MNVSPQKNSVQENNTKMRRHPLERVWGYTYILVCKDGTLYTGATHDLKKRLYQHNHAKSGAHYTKIRRPVVLKYAERHRSLAAARKREVAIKRWTRAKKLALCASWRRSSEGLAS